MKKVFYWLKTHTGLLLMIVVNVLLVFGVFQNIPNLPGTLLIPASKLSIMSYFLAATSVALFISVIFWIVKASPHSKSHGFFKFVLVYLLPAVVLGISSISISPEVPPQAYIDLGEALADFEKAHNIEQIKTTYERLKVGLVEEHRGQINYYMTRLHQGIYFFLASLINLVFAVGFHLAGVKTIEKKRLRMMELVA